MNKISPKVSEEDIKVYKIMLFDGWSDTLSSFYFGKKYKISKKYTEDIVVVSPNSLKAYYSVYKGFHSYSNEMTELKAFNGRWVPWSKYDDMPIDVINLNEDVGFDKKLVAVECIIPKGSRYYENEYGEIVSDHIIITDKIFKEYNKIGTDDVLASVE